MGFGVSCLGFDFEIMTSGKGLLGLRSGKWFRRCRRLDGLWRDSRPDGDVEKGVQGLELRVSGSGFGVSGLVQVWSRPWVLGVFLFIGIAVPPPPL